MHIQPIPFSVFFSSSFPTSLDLRERQIIILRFGLNDDHQPKSLEYIGKIFKVSKEWRRNIEKKALTKLRNETNISKLNYYLDM